MGGLFGVVSKGDCVSDLFFGTDYHSHLGTKRGGLAVKNSEGIIRFIHNIENAQFRSKFEEDIVKLSGNRGIGSISDFEDQPVLIRSHLGSYAIVTVGVIQKDGIQNALDAIEGSCPLLLLTAQGIYAARDKYGRTPIVIGKKSDGYAATSETCAFPNLDYEVMRYLGPGEIALMTEDGLEQKKAPGEKMQICGFLWVYYGFPASSYEDINVESVRNRCGAFLAKREDREIDLVAGIPDSGTGHGLGYASEARIPFKRPFVKYTPTWPRSFMPQDQDTRDLVAKMKLIPIQDLIEDKRLLFCEDSIVRGTQLQDTIQRLFESGAREIHMRPACPPLVYACKFLNFSRSKSEMDLAGRKAIYELEGAKGDPASYSNPDSEKYEGMVAQIRKRLKLTSLRYQRLPDLVQAIGLPKEKLCTYCWDGVEIK